MILNTTRLVLRPMVESDAPALFAILGDPAAMAFWDRPALPRLAALEAQLADELAAMAAGRFFCWTALQEDAVVGSVDLSFGEDGAAIGFAFRRDKWGQGLAREALAAVIAHGFGVFRFERLMARVQSDNRRAIALLLALGFQEIGKLPDIVRGGEARPRLRYGLERSASRNG